MTFTARALDELRTLAGPPGDDAETATLRKVRQSRRYQLWWVSHAYHPEVAPVFVRGNEHQDRLLADPQLAADVARWINPVSRCPARPRLWRGRCPRLSYCGPARNFGSG